MAGRGPISPSPSSSGWRRSAHHKPIGCRKPARRFTYVSDLVSTVDRAAWVADSAIDEPRARHSGPYQRRSRAWKLADGAQGTSSPVVPVTPRTSRPTATLDRASRTGHRWPSGDQSSGSHQRPGDREAGARRRHLLGASHRVGKLPAVTGWPRRTQAPQRVQPGDSGKHHSGRSRQRSVRHDKTLEPGPQTAPEGT